MTTHSEKHMDEILRELIDSGDIKTPVTDELANHFLSKASARPVSNSRKKLQKAFMAARFKAITRKKTGLVPHKQIEAMTFGGYLSFVRSTLKATIEIAADACRISEQALRGVEESARDIFKDSVLIIVDIVDGFSIPMDATGILLRNTLAASQAKRGGATVFPRAGIKTQCIVGAYEAGLLAIAKATGKTPTVTVNPVILAKIKDELTKRGRADLLR